MSQGRLLIYVLRRDLRVSDNPIFHQLATTTDHGFTHLLPVFNFPSQQVELSGFLNNGGSSPFPPAISKVGKFWRCGPHRAEFLAQSVWNLKENLEKLDSGLCLRVGNTSDVVKGMIEHFRDKGPSVAAVWMTEEPSHEEVQEQNAVAKVCSDYQVDFKLWEDEKYFIDDRDTKLEAPADLPDVFTNYRKMQEPLRKRPRPVLPRPTKSSLPPFPPADGMPSQRSPFVMADTLDDLISRLQKPLTNILANPPPRPEGAVSAHMFSGGESAAQDRLQHLINSGSITTYKDTRNGLLGLYYSTKLGGYLSLGCLTARQIHEEMLKLEDGSDAQYSQANGYGQGENNGTSAIRFELLWRDYMRLSTKKFGVKLFQAAGFRQDQQTHSHYKTWLTADEDQAESDQDPPPEEVSKILERFFEGSTGMGLIDASQRELFLTGYTSNRARQNVASFLSKHLGIDWRYGAEWYEMMLIDYDVSSNWANWQYLAGVGNDPRSDDRIFNPVKQAFDYDKEGSYVRMWVPEIQGLQKLQHLFQACTASKSDLAEAGITKEHVMFTKPLKRIPFEVNYKAKSHRGGKNWRGSAPRRGNLDQRGGRAGNRSFASQCNGGQLSHQVSGWNNNAYTPQDNDSDDPPSYSSLPPPPPPPPPLSSPHRLKEGFRQYGAGLSIGDGYANSASNFRPSFVSNVNVHIQPSHNPFEYPTAPGQVQNGGAYDYPNFYSPGHQTQVYHFQTYQPQTYQPQAQQPRAYQYQFQPQQCQVYEAPRPHLNGLSEYSQANHPAFGFPATNHPGYQPQAYPSHTSQGNASLGHQDFHSQGYQGYREEPHYTGGWGGYANQGGPGGRGWGYVNGGGPVESRQPQSTPTPPSVLPLTRFQVSHNQENRDGVSTPQQQPSIVCSEKREMAVLPGLLSQNLLHGPSENPRTSENYEKPDTIPQQPEAPLAANSTDFAE